MTTKLSANQRREAERFGQHPLWRRVCGLTFSSEATVSRKDRKRGLRRLVRWIEKRAKNPVIAPSARATSVALRATAGSPSGAITEPTPSSSHTPTPEPRTLQRRSRRVQTPTRSRRTSSR